MAYPKKRPKTWDNLGNHKTAQNLPMVTGLAAGVATADTTLTR